MCQKWNYQQWFFFVNMNLKIIMSSLKCIDISFPFCSTFNNVNVIILSNDTDIRILKINILHTFFKEIHSKLLLLKHYTLGVKVRKLKVEFKTGGTWHCVGQ